jgi:acyl carrier protein
LRQRRESAKAQFAKEMTCMSIRSEILNQFTQVAREQNRNLSPLTDDLSLMDSGLDSLCFAIVVARLEDALEIDPLSASDDTAFPVTLGQFIAFYENATR